MIGENDNYRRHRDPEFEKIFQNLKCREECLDKVIFYRDSFGAELIDLLLYNTNQLNVIHSKDLDLKYIRKQKPDLVIFEVVERNMDVLLKLITPKELKAEFGY